MPWMRVSAFVTCADSETWAGKIHPAQALRQSRHEFVGNATQDTSDHPAGAEARRAYLAELLIRWRRGFFAPGRELGERTASWR
jgi:hypothetical protein